MLAIIVLPQVVGATSGYVSQRREARESIARERDLAGGLHAMGAAQTAVSDVEDAVMGADSNVGHGVGIAPVRVVDERIDALSRRFGARDAGMPELRLSWARAREAVLEGGRPLVSLRGLLRALQRDLARLGGRVLARASRATAVRAASSRRASVSRAVVVALAITSALLAAWFLHVGLRRALAGLMFSASRFADGDLEHRVGCARFDELTQVGDALNAMAQGLAASRQELVEIAFHDALTGLANRRLLYQRVDEALADATRPGSVALLLIDIDDFKAINDSLGHGAGEDVLVELARRLTDAVPSEALVARVGGDEFAVLLERLANERDAETVAAHVIDAHTQPVCVGERELAVSVSVGVALAEHRMSADGLMRSADLAMYAAKRDGKRRCRAYRPAMLHDAHERLELGGDLKAAVDGDAIDLHYQPIVELDSGRIIGAEALARWTHPTRGPIAPDRFIALAEETGVLVALGRQVLARACADLPLLRARLGPHLRVGVNLSATELLQPGLCQRIAALLAAHDLEPRALTLEITESVLVRDLHAAEQRVRELHELGVGLALDDFGTGYSSLAYLRHLPVDVLKIDKAFITHVADPSSSDRALVQAILNLARPFGLSVLAEGIETPAQRDALVGLGCPLGQGFLLSRPLPVADLVAPAATLVTQPQALGERRDPSPRALAPGRPPAR